MRSCDAWPGFPGTHTPVLVGKLIETCHAASLQSRQARTEASAALVRATILRGLVRQMIDNGATPWNEAPWPEFSLSPGRHIEHH